jgi:hypothetical protein
VAPERDRGFPTGGVWVSQRVEHLEAGERDWLWTTSIQSTQESAFKTRLTKETDSWRDCAIASGILGSLGFRFITTISWGKELRGTHERKMQGTSISSCSHSGSISLISVKCYKILQSEHEKDHRIQGTNLDVVAHVWSDFADGLVIFTQSMMDNIFDMRDFSIRIEIEQSREGVLVQICR